MKLRKIAVSFVVCIALMFSFAPAATAAPSVASVPSVSAVAVKAGMSEWVRQAWCKTTGNFCKYKTTCYIKKVPHKGILLNKYVCVKVKY